MVKIPVMRSGVSVPVRFTLCPRTRERPASERLPSRSSRKSGQEMPRLPKALSALAADLPRTNTSRSGSG